MSKRPRRNHSPVFKAKVHRSTIARFALVIRPVRPLAAVRVDVTNGCFAASCRYVHDAESLLPGGRGAPTQIDEVTLPRVRWAKDPVGLNRRSDGGGLWVLNR